MTKITGYGDNLSINNVKIGDLTPLEHEKIETKILPESSEKLLIYVPSDSSDKNFRVVFKSDGRLITRLWSGRLPWVEMAEIC